MMEEYSMLGRRTKSHKIAPADLRIGFIQSEGCGKCRQTLENLREALNELGIKVEINVVNIGNGNQSSRLQYLSTPSIRFNGQEVFAGKTESAPDGPNCRRFVSGLEIVGYPSREMLIQYIKSWLANDEARRWLLLL